MILERVGAPVFGVTAAAISAAPNPVQWQALGYQFEAASLLIALFAASVTRIIIGMRDKTIGRAVDWAVLALVLTATAAIVIGTHATMIPAFAYGTILAVSGEGILKFAEQRGHRVFEALFGSAPAPAPPVPPAAPDDIAAIEAAMHQLDQIPDRKD